MPALPLSSVFEPQAFFAVFKLHVRDACAAGCSERLPISFKVRAFEAAALDLLGEQAVNDRMIDVFEKLAVDRFVNFSRHAVGINQQDGDTWAAPPRPVSPHQNPVKAKSSPCKVSETSIYMFDNKCSWPFRF